MSELRRIMCPYHEETTASLHIYETHAHCFGCGKHVTVAQLEKDTQGGYTKPSFRFKTTPPPVDMLQCLGRISLLPTKPIRGFRLPYDATGYYIVYPNVKYYVKRLWEAADTGKYQSPKGHKKPMLEVVHDKAFLVVVEGQMNCLSAAQAVRKGTFCTPGGAGDLARPDFVKYYLQYNCVYVIVDKDAAGVAAAVTLRDILVMHKIRVTVVAMGRDCNEIYANDGKEALRKELYSKLDLPEQSPVC